MKNEKRVKTLINSNINRMAELQEEQWRRIMEKKNGGEEEEE